MNKRGEICKRAFQMCSKQHPEIIEIDFNTGWAMAVVYMVNAQFGTEAAMEVAQEAGLLHIIEDLN